MSANERLARRISFASLVASTLFLVFVGAVLGTSVGASDDEQGAVIAVGDPSSLPGSGGEAAEDEAMSPVDAARAEIVDTADGGEVSAAPAGSAAEVDEPDSIDAQVVPQEAGQDGGETTDPQTDDVPVASAAITAVGAVPVDGGPLTLTVAVVNTGEIELAFNDPHFELVVDGTAVPQVLGSGNGFGPRIVEVGDAVSATMAFELPSFEDSIVLRLAAPTIEPVEFTVLG